MKEFLTALQAANAKRFGITFTYLTKEALIADTYIPMKEEREDFDTNYAVFELQLPQKDPNSKKVIVLDQDQLKELIADEITEMGDLVKAYAKKYKNSTLKKEYKFNKWNITSLAQTELLPFITRVTNLLTPLLDDTNFKKYKITAPQILVITENATLYNTNIGVAGTTSTEVTAANTNINNTINLLTDNINQIILLNAYFKSINPDFHDGIIKNTRRQYPAVHATAMSGYVFGKDDKPLVGCMVRIIGTDKTTVTDAKGFYSLDTLTVGTYQALACNEAGDSETITIEILYRHTQKYDFHLV